MAYLCEAIVYVLFVIYGFVKLPFMKIQSMNEPLTAPNENEVSPFWIANPWVSDDVAFN